MNGNLKVQGVINAVKLEGNDSELKIMGELVQLFLIPKSGIIVWYPNKLNTEKITVLRDGPYATVKMPPDSIQTSVTKREMTWWVRLDPGIPCFLHKLEPKNCFLVS